MAETFGHYEVHELLGRGGMGEVHRATDLRKPREVALKRLPPDMAGLPEFRARFRREADAAARLVDPHVIPVHDYGEIEGRFYVDMRLVHGSDLGRALRSSGAMAPERSVDIVAHVAAALDAAHGEGLVHRDVKPSNILLATTSGSEDFAYLIDFGMVASLEAIGAASSTALVGTPRYMSPEAFAGHGRTDPRSDVYSLGCVLYEMLTGQPPFEGESLANLMFQHLESPPPAPSAVSRSVPPGLDAVVAQALAKDSSERFAGAGDLAAAAQAVVRPPARSGATTSTAPPPGFPRQPGTAGLVFGVDLGTTYSCVALARSDGPAEVLELIDGSRTLPSVVLFVGPDDYVTGERARVRARAEPDDVCTLVKRRMGDSDWRFVSYGRRWSAPAVSGLILKALISEAEFATEGPMQDVVITVPAYFGDEERRSTKLAGEYAKLRVLDVINEPTAAALSYGFARLDGSVGTGDSAEVALVYDLGGGTVDVTVVELAERRLSVVAIDGDHELGGADWDEKLAVHLARAFRARHPDAEDPLDDGAGTQALVLLAERTKRRLSEHDSVVATVEHDGATADITVTREEFERLTATLLDRTVQLTRQVVAAARERGVHRLDRALLVGGSSRMPAIGRRLADLLGVPVDVHDPDLAVARGAAIYGRKKALERLLLADLVTRGQLVEGVPLDLAAPEDVTNACARLATAYGLSPAEVRRTAEIQVVNVCSRGFGVLALDRYEELSATYLVHRNDRLPLAVRRSFGTLRDDQDVVTIRVVEQVGGSESPRPEDGKIIAEASIVDIPPGFPAGSQVEVTLGMGFDGILVITAVHEALPDRALTLRVETSASLSQADVARQREQVARAHRRDT